MDSDRSRRGFGLRGPVAREQLTPERKTLVHRYMTEAPEAQNQVVRDAEEGVGREMQREPSRKKPAAVTAGTRSNGSAPGAVDARVTRSEPDAVSMRAPGALSDPSALPGRTSVPDPVGSPLTERWQRFFWAHRSELILYSTEAVIAAAIGILISHAG